MKCRAEDQTCYLSNAQTAICTIALTVKGTPSGATYTVITTTTATSSLWYPVTITAGLEKLPRTMPPTDEPTGGGAAPRPTGACTVLAMGGMAVAAGMLL